MSNFLLLTGATGLLGRYLLRDLLLAGVPLAVLLRPRGKESARGRLEDVMAHWEADRGRRLPRPVCLEGDITRAGLGLSAGDLGWVAGNCGRVLHNAASLTFYGADRARDPWLSNLTGTRNVLELCRAAGLRELHHVSTAYVCGKRGGTVLEADPGPGGGFRNDYEHSKWEAEQLLRSADCLDSLTVYRPAVIVGDSATGYTTTYHGLYAYAHLAWVVSRHAEAGEGGRRRIPVRLNLTGDEGRNLVPVDWVSAVTAHLLLDPRCHGRTYHLTPRRPVTAREIEAALSSHFNYFGPTFVGRDGLAGAPLNDLERLFYGGLGWYEPYWAAEPQFDCANTRAAAPHLPAPLIDEPVLHRLLDYAVRDRWGKGPARRPGRAGDGRTPAP
jgi:nucleoside-diphosphate-sugar epimerase